MRSTATVVLALAVAVSGCSFGAKRDRPLIEPIEDYQAPPLPAPEPETEEPTLVNRLLELQQRYAQAVQDLSDERDAKRQLSDEKRKLSGEVASLRAELARAQKELQEANDLLIAVRQENDKWKHNVLGYRDEMRESQKAILVGLAKVARQLGMALTPLPPEPQTEPATTSTSASAPSAHAPAPETGKTLQETKGTASENTG